MQIKNYWVGDIPGGNWNFQVLDQRTGEAQSLRGYTSAQVVMMDSDNNRIEFPGQSQVTDPDNGMVTFAWPSDASPFPKSGRYQIQLELRGATAVRKTTVQEILVREIGGVTK